MSLSPDVFARGENFSRVPYALYHGESVYAQEQQRIFRGRAWNYLCLEAEITAPGDFRVVSVGDTPVIVQRRRDGGLAAFENRCAHRGATVRRESHGNAPEHVCVYHRWCYDENGALTGVPFKRGVQGKGGMPSTFDSAQHGLRPLRVESVSGAVFGTFHHDMEPVTAYLGETLTGHIRRLLHKPLRILGYQRQAIHGNWKFYMENVRDTYHGSLLHEFQGTFGISRATHKGGASMDHDRKHHISFNTGDDAENAQQLYADAGLDHGKLRLQDPRLLLYKPEFDDGLQFTMCSVFPNAVFQQIRNCLATRQVRTKGHGAFDLVVTLYGYADDSEEMTAHRLRQANMVGPAGYISMEDGEAIEIAHRASAIATGSCSLIEMGGTGPIPERVDFRASEVPIRGFWSHYATLMAQDAA
jgi:anthranilate 1,2-dioxygenase large subunit